MKLTNYIPLILGLCLLVFVSCKDEGEKGETPETQSEQVETNENNGTTAALNPAHGQPGHTCAIPVGAPLSQANNTTTQQSSPTTTTSNISPVRVNSSSATPQKNPPHGQPGHSCAVPVGADLNN